MERDYKLYLPQFRISEKVRKEIGNLCLIGERELPNHHNPNPSKEIFWYGIENPANKRIEKTKEKVKKNDKA